MINSYSVKKCVKSRFFTNQFASNKTLRAAKLFTVAAFFAFTSTANAQQSCVPVNVPYTVPFETAVVPGAPECITIQNVNGDDKTWVSSNTTGGIAGNAMVYSYSFSQSANDWFYTRKLNLTAGLSYRLTFKYRVSLYQEKLKIAVGTASNAVAMTQTLEDMTISGTTSGVQDKIIDFSVATTGAYNVGFQAHSDANMNTLFVGEIALTATPTCLVPSNIVFDLDSVSETGLAFSWTASPSTPALGYDYEIRTEGAAGSGSTGLAASGSVAAGVTSATITGLNSGTSYRAYVRAKCAADDNSVWIESAAMATVCTPLSIPYTLPLATATAPNLPLCVTIENANEDDKFWKTNSSVVGLQGTVMEYSYSTTQAANDWFYTAPLNLTAGITYRLLYKYKILGYEEKLKVAVGTEAISSSMTQVLRNITIPASQSAVVPEDISFTVPTSGVYYVGYQAYSAVDRNSLYIAEVSVILDPTACVAPTNVVISSITTNSATISWMAAANAPANGYKYEVRTLGEAGSGATGLAASGTTAAGITTADITSFTPNTDYAVYIASICGIGNSSAWNQVTQFTTLCVAPVITAEHMQTIAVDAIEDATLANLIPSGENVTWFANAEDAEANTSPLLITTQLVSGTTYFAVLTDSGCSSAPFDVTVTITLGLANQTMTGLTYYPNPVQNQLNINYTQTITSVSVFNLVGQKVMALTPHASNVTIDMSTLAAGTYMIQVNADAASKMIKLIKK